MTQQYLHGAYNDPIPGLWQEQPDHPKPVQRVTRIIPVNNQVTVYEGNLRYTRKNRKP
jgi:hypothetical protein